MESWVHSCQNFRCFLDCICKKCLDLVCVQLVVFLKLLAVNGLQQTKGYIKITLLGIKKKKRNVAGLER